MPKLASEKFCTGCMACFDACKHRALLKVEKNGMPFVDVDFNKCVHCGLCEKTCPVITPLRKNKSYEMKVYGGWAKNEEIRINAASGGAFSGLAQSFFHLHDGEKVAVVGAALECNRVYHLLVESEDELKKLTNSKYIQSDTRGIYVNVAEKLKLDYWVLFSGCPCQIAGLYGYLGRNRDIPKLVTIELVCHGIAGNEALDLHLKHYNSSRIYRFRDKRLGSQDWKYSQTTTIEKNGKEMKLARKDDVFYSIYSGWMLNRKSCSNCKFSEINRVADITIADFWGLSVPEYYKQGVSMIIANNEKANSLIRESESMYVFEASFRTAINGNPNLFNGYKFIQYHPIVLWPDFFRNVLSEKVRFYILSNKMPYKLLWALYKLATNYLIMIKRKRLFALMKKDNRYSYLLRDVKIGGVKWPSPIPLIGNRSEK